MTTTTEKTEKASWKDRSELGICALLAVLGVLVLVDAIRIPTDFAQRGPVGPKAVPILVGVLLLVTAALLARDVLRGGRGEAMKWEGEEGGGEDIDLTAPSDWRTVLLLSAAFLANAALIGVVGFPISGAILFWGAAYALGSRNPVRDPLIAAAMSILTFVLFNNLLGVPLPGGPLMEVF
ncbi:tripartite tricarboxylate transporter TctB family protein [Actinophytocola sp.]|uniref:tripartite tricarboxylate transporter TctB family protein n=1 Tax=Actinophytocola sp. TaxID=1872138 RepID=UPI00389A109A